MNCENHKKEVAGISDMKVLAEMIGDLHYEAAAQLFDHLGNKYWVDSLKDEESGKIKVAKKLTSAKLAARIIQLNMSEAWQISKPYMEGETK